MKTRRLTILLMCLCMAFSFCACTNTENIRGSISSDDAGKDSTGSQKESSDDPSGSSSDDQAEPSSEGEAEAELSLGHNSNNVYENKFIGIGCKLDSEWTFLSDDDILAQNQLTSELVGDEYKDILESANLLTDMMANHSNGMDTLNVQIEKLPFAYSTMTVQQYIDASKDQAAGPLQSMGADNIVVTTTEITFAGEKRPCIALSGEYSGYPFYETFVPLKCSGGYIASVVACTWYEDTTVEVLNNFYAMD